MRILFLGTSPFAVPCLQRLLSEPAHELLGVVTQPDRPHGRGGKVAIPPVKEAAQGAGLTVFQPEIVRAKEFVQSVRVLAPDVLVVAAFGQIIPQRMLDIPPFGGINVHGSLLPRWRGAAPMQYALMAGDPETGVTTMQMDAGLDTGDILLKAALSLEAVENLGALEPKLAELGADLLLETLTRLERGDCPRAPQDEALVTFAPSLPPDIGALDWSRPARDLHNLIRGVTPRPGAYGIWQGKRLKIWQSAVVSDTGDGEAAPGMVKNVGAQGITIKTGEGALRLLQVQPESKARMAADAWARGARVSAGQQFKAIGDE
jgi:methionyl-tRNA formyltransferase